MRESRRHPRVEANLVMRAKYFDVDEFVSQFAVNLSSGGMFIKSRKLYPKGTILSFEIQLQDGSRMLRGKGTVVWSRDASNTEGKPAGMGIKFNAMDKSSKSLLKKILASKAKQDIIDKQPKPNNELDPGDKTESDQTKEEDKADEDHTLKSRFEKLQDRYVATCVENDTLRQELESKNKAYDALVESVEVLKESKTKYKSIVQNINDAIIFHNFMGEILEVNENACKLLGCDRSEIIGSLIDDIGTAEHISDQIAKLIDAGSLVYESRFTKKDGQEVPISASGKVVSIDNQGLIQTMIRIKE